MFAQYLASESFRLLHLPVMAALAVCLVKCSIALVRGRSITLEDFSIWIELMLVSAANLVTVASDAAKQIQGLAPEHQTPYTEFFLKSTVFSMGTIAALWFVSLIAALPRSRPFGRLFWGWIFPHVAALALLWGIYDFASGALPIDCALCVPSP